MKLDDGIAAAPLGRSTAEALARPAARREESVRRAAPVAPWVLAGLSGLIVAAAFPPLAWPAAAWVGLVPLLVACAGCSPRQAAVAGLCWTAGLAAGVAAFLPGMLSGYFGLGEIPSWIAAVAVVAGLHGAYVSGYAAWVAWLVRRGAAHPLLLAGGWMVCELARAHGPLGTPWGLLAYAQRPWPVLLQSADVAGVFGIGLLIAAVNASLAAWAVPALRGRRPLASAVATAAAVAAVLLYGEWRLGQRFADGPPVTVAVVQGGAPTTESRARAERLERQVALTVTVPQGTGLVVWPEHAVDGYLEEPSPARDTVLRAAAGTGADVIIGGPHYEAVPVDEDAQTVATRYHNSAYLVRDGRLAARYDKQRLVPVAEDQRLAWLLGPTGSGYTPGTGATVLAGAGLRVGPLICFEAMFSDLARRAVADGAEVMVNLSNDAWFGSAAAARLQLDVAALRAVETRRYLVRAAATGISAVVDPHGRVLAKRGFGSVGVLTAPVHAAQIQTFHQRWGDAVAWIVAAAVAVATLAAAARPSRTTQRRIT